MTSAPASASATAGVGLRSERGPVLLALMLSTGLVALDSTIIATAVPSIVGQLGGFSQFPWLFSVYLLTQAVTVPLYGKFADLRGRKPVLLLGIGLFLLGSVLCGIAWSMPALIAFRGLQGVGAGAVAPMTITIVGDLYSVEERAKVQGYVASVWAMASVLGPTLGGLFAQYLSWRWIFFVNLPLGALAVWMLRHFTEDVHPGRHRIDVAGAVLLTSGCSLVVLGLLEGGVAWAWASVTGVSVFVAGGLLLLAFFAVERRAEEPVLPLWVFRPRVLVAGNLAGAAVGVLLIGLTSYVPTYVQGVLGTGPLVAGFALAALTIGWPLAASFAGRVYMSVGFRSTALAGSAVVLTGTLLCALLHEGAHVWQVAAVCFVVGLGLGLTNVPTLVAVQSVVGWRHRGVVTATNMFSRNIGSAVGVAVFGAIANATLAARFADPPAGVTGHLPASVDAAGDVVGSGHAASGVAEPVLAFVRSALYDATHHVFVGLVVAALGLGAAVLLMPRKVREIDVDALVVGSRRTR